VVAVLVVEVAVDVEVVLDVAVEVVAVTLVDVIV